MEPYLRAPQRIRCFLRLAYKERILTNAEKARRHLSCCMSDLQLCLCGFLSSSSILRAIVPPIQPRVTLSILSLQSYVSNSNKKKRLLVQSWTYTQGYNFITLFWNLSWTTFSISSAFLSSAVWSAHWIRESHRFESYLLEIPFAVLGESGFLCYVLLRSSERLFLGWPVLESYLLSRLYTLFPIQKNVTLQFKASLNETKDIILSHGTISLGLPKP